MRVEGKRREKSDRGMRDEGAFTVPYSSLKLIMEIQVAGSLG